MKLAQFYMSLPSSGRSSLSGLLFGVLPEVRARRGRALFWVPHACTWPWVEITWWCIPALGKEGGMPLVPGHAAPWQPPLLCPGCLGTEGAPDAVTGLNSSCGRCRGKECSSSSSLQSKQSRELSVQSPV